MNLADQRAQIEQYVQKAFLAKIMQMNEVRQDKKLELRGELSRHGHSLNSSAWMIGEIEIEEDCIADLLRQKGELYIEAYSRLGLRIGLDVLRDISRSQVELTAARKSSLVGEPQHLVNRTNRPQNLVGYGRLGKKASVAMKEIEANIDLYNLSHPTTDEAKGDIGPEKSRAREGASGHPNGREAKRAHCGEVEKPRIPIDLDSSRQKTIWMSMWSWLVVSFFVSFMLGGWMTLMTTGQPHAANGFLVLGTALFLAKFWTWEEARRQSARVKWFLIGSVTILSLALATLAFRWNHTVNRSAVTNHPPVSRPSIVEPVKTANPPIRGPSSGSLSGSPNPKSDAPNRGPDPCKVLPFDKRPIFCLDRGPK